MSVAEATEPLVSPEGKIPEWEKRPVTSKEVWDVCVRLACEMEMQQGSLVAIGLRGVPYERAMRDAFVLKKIALNAEQKMADAARAKLGQRK